MITSLNYTRNLGPWATDRIQIQQLVSILDLLFLTFQCNYNLLLDSATNYFPNPSSTREAYYGFFWKVTAYLPT